MKEWEDKFNSFNSMKGLLYANWYKAIARGVFLPPVEASLDPIHACNLRCQHCNANRYLDKPQAMSRQHLLDLVAYLGAWGVKAICFGGGGEPTLHPDLEDALWATSSNGMQASIATNGTLLTPRLIDTITITCRWIGVSIDAATPETYAIGRKADLFNKAIKNLKTLASVAKGSACDVSFKFLIFNYNQHEIFAACKLAKSLGVKDFHARPADFSHQGMGKLAKKQGGYDVEQVLDQFKLCHDLNDNDFHVYTIVHKFDSSFLPRKNFSQCYAAPCCIQLCADGNIYHCPDQRHQEGYRIGRHDPISGIELAWGNEKHRDLVYSSGKERCTSRCTFSPYNEQCERLFINEDDPMCRWFI
jgi:MoaA/NifB/PqqE/SkfB family radical SAM enzyme